MPRHHVRLPAGIDNGEISDTDWNAMEIGVEKET